MSRVTTDVKMAVIFVRARHDTYLLGAHLVFWCQAPRLVVKTCRTTKERSK